jgi:hypothetical protein
MQEKLRAVEAHRTAVDAAMHSAAARLFSSPDLQDLLMQNFKWTWGQKGAGKCLGQHVVVVLNTSCYGYPCNTACDAQCTTCAATPAPLAFLITTANTLPMTLATLLVEDPLGRPAPGVPLVVGVTQLNPVLRCPGW